MFPTTTDLFFVLCLACFRNDNEIDFKSLFSPLIEASSSFTACLQSPLEDCLVSNRRLVSCVKNYDKSSSRSSPPEKSKITSNFSMSRRVGARKTCLKIVVPTNLISLYFVHVAEHSTIHFDYLFKSTLKVRWNGMCKLEAL